MPQLNLNFTDIPIPETCLWEQFDEQQKRTVSRVKFPCMPGVLAQELESALRLYSARDAQARFPRATVLPSG